MYIIDFADNEVIEINRERDYKCTTDKDKCANCVIRSNAINSLDHKIKKRYSNIKNSYKDCNYDEEEDDCISSNKEVFIAVMVIMVPVILCCMIMSLCFPPPKTDSRDAKNIFNDVNYFAPMDSKVENNNEGHVDEIFNGE